MQEFTQITRRGLAGCSLALFAEGCAVPRGTEPMKPEWRVKLPVWINGNGPFLFTLDTMAQRSLVADDIAASFNNTRHGPVNVQGVARNIPTRTVNVDLTLESGRRHSAELAILPRKLIDGDGELGADVLGEYRVTVDLSAKSVTLEASADSKQMQCTGATCVGGEMDSGMMWAHCLVDDSPCRATLATGAEVAVGNPALLKALEEGGSPIPILRSLPITGETGGIVQAQVIHVDRIKLGQAIFSDAMLAIADLAVFGKPGFPSEPALLVGMNFLRQFEKVAIDYPASMFCFALPQDGTASPSRC